MIYINSYVKIVDNSGGLIFFFIKIYGKRKIASKGIFGDIVIGSVKTVSLKKKKIKKGTLYKAVIVRTKNILTNVDGISLFFYTSGVVLLNNKMLPIANRIFGVIPKKIIKKGFLKIASLAFATL
jgi:large subunit ribosomal protein L14